MEKNQGIDLKCVGERIRTARRKLNLTQEKAAESTDFTGQYWSLLETGRERGSIAAYLQIAGALGLTLDDLFYTHAPSIRLSKTFSESSLFDDCSAYEKTIISEMVFALKDILRRTDKQ